MSQSEGEDEDYYVPLEDQRVFGAGIKRKRIAFVPAQNNDDSLPRPSTSTSTGLGDRYLSIVLGKKSKQDPAVAVESPEAIQICEVCKQPLSKSGGGGGGGGGGISSTGSHESSIAHQLCLAHSHPPSHLDRDHVGVRYLKEYGWDPNARTGLGARQEGIRAPVKAREKKDTAGLGLDAVDEEEITVKRKTTVKKEGKVVMLDAGQIRKLENGKKKRAEKLRQSFYGEDLSRYLGPDG